MPQLPCRGRLRSGLNSSRSRPPSLPIRSLRGGAATKTIDALLARGFVEETVIDEHGSSRACTPTPPATVWLLHAGPARLGGRLHPRGHAGSEAEIAEWMSGNIYRCAAYPQIVAAVQQAAAALEG